MLNLATTQRAQYLDVDAKPLSLGRVTYYEVDTTILKSIYADPDAVIELSNPLLLDIGGFVPESGVFYGVGNYKIVVERCINPDSPELERIYETAWTMPEVPGSEISNITSNSTLFIDAVEQLPSLNPGEYEYVYCQQYYNSTDIDSGGGWFKWFPSSTAVPDLGTVFSTTGSPAIGRYIRIYSDNNVLASYYGVWENKGSSMSSRLVSASTYANSNNMTLVLIGKTIEISGITTLNIGNCVIDNGFKVKRFETLTDTELVINCSKIQVNSSSSLVVSIARITINSSAPFPVNPIWWGADNNGVNDSTTALSYAAQCANFSNSPVVIEGAYLLTGAGASGQPIVEINELTFLPGSYIQTIYPMIKFGKVNYPLDETYFIRTPINNDFQYLSSLTGSVDASVIFNISTPSNFYYWRLNNLQENNTVSIRINWNAPRATGWTINGSMFNEDVAKKTYHYFTPGNYVNLGSFGLDVAHFGRIRTQTDCLNTEWAAPYQYVGDVFYMQWWGIDDTTSGSFVARAIKNSIIAAALSAADDYVLGAGVLDFGGLNLNSNDIGLINLGKKNLIIKNGFVLFASGGMQIDDAGYIEFYKFNGSYNVTSSIKIKIDTCYISTSLGLLFTTNDLIIKDSEIQANSLLFDVGTICNVYNNTINSLTTLKFVLSQGSKIVNNNFSVPVRLIEYYRHIEFNNVSGSTISGNIFKGTNAIGSSVPTQNLGFVWITGAGGASYVRGFSMFGNQFIDATFIQSAVIGYPNNFIKEMAWITQNDLSVDGHIADVYDNYGNIYVAPDVNGNLPNAMLIPGTRCIIPRIYVGVGNEATFYFILPKSIAGLAGDPNFRYVNPVKMTSGPNTLWASAAIIPASVQPPVISNPPFSAKIRNQNTFQINAEVWVSSGCGNQIYS